MSSLNKQLQEADYLRVLIIYFACFDLNTKDKETMLKSVMKESYREAVRNLEYMDAGLRGDQKKFQRS